MEKLEPVDNKSEIFTIRRVRCDHFVSCYFANDATKAVLESGKAITTKITGNFFFS